MVSKYVMILGAALALMGSMELIARERAFTLWVRWFAHRLFFLQGAALIALGFPLTFYAGRWSTFVFIVGLVMVVTGPFLLVYPDRIRDTFGDISSESGEESLRGLVVLDAAVRVIIGILFVYCSMGNA